MDDAREWKQLLAEQARQHHRLYFRLAYGILRDVQAAEDACQQAFLKAWQQRDGVRDAARLKAWLTRVVVNESLQDLRRGQAESRGRSGYSRTQAPYADDSHPADVREAAIRALEGLPEETRMIVVLRLMQGMSGNDVKTLLGCSASEVSRRLHHGMEHLRQRLAPIYVEDQAEDIR